MSIFKRTLLGLALGLSLIAQAGAATTVVSLTADGLWHDFDVYKLTSLSGSLEWIDFDGNTLAFEVINATPMNLTVVDGGFAGDRFTVRDGSVFIGTTSTATNNYPSSLGLDFDAAMLDSKYSKRTYLLNPGSHMIFGSLSTSAKDGLTPLNATVGAVMLQAVPEPAQWATLIAGLFMLTFAQRARKSRK